MISNIISIKEIKEKAMPIFQSYPVDKAILFGSYAKGESTNNSDIDLYIDTKGKLKGLDFVGLLEILVDTLGINIDLIDKSHIESDSLIIKEIENKGMVIYEKSKDYLEEKIEDEMDMKNIKEYEEDVKNGNVELYTHSEVMKILDL